MSLSPHKRAWLRLFLSCIVIFGASFLVRTFLVPELPTSWTVELAFVLHAAELFGGFGAILLALAALGATIYPRRKTCTVKITEQSRRV